MILTNDEREFFLRFCKHIREHQDAYSKVDFNIYEYTMHITNVHDEGYGVNVKKKYAIAYSLRDKGFIKINNKKCISLDKKGFEYIQFLRNQAKGSK